MAATKVGLLRIPCQNNACTASSFLTLPVETYQQNLCPLLVFEGRPRNKQTIEATAGAVTGEATFEGKLEKRKSNP